MLDLKPEAPPTLIHLSFNHCCRRELGQPAIIAFLVPSVKNTFPPCYLQDSEIRLYTASGLESQKQEPDLWWGCFCPPTPQGVHRSPKAGVASDTSGSPSPLSLPHPVTGRPICPKALKLNRMF